MEIIDKYVTKETTMKGKTKKASLAVIQCKLPEGQSCELRQRGMCRHKRLLAYCEWGNLSIAGSVTRQAGSYLRQLKQFEEESAKYPSLSGQIPNGIYRVGDYVLVEFPHVNLVSGDQRIPWTHREGFLSGNPGAYIPASEFTAEVAVRIATQQPTAMFGGVIPSYQSEVAPAFLVALRDFDRSIFDAALASCPALLQKVELLDTDIMPITWADVAQYMSPRNQHTKVQVTLPDGNALPESSIIFDKGICLSVPIDVKPLVPNGAALHSERAVLKPTIEIRPDDASLVEFSDPAERLRFLNRKREAESKQ